MKLLPCQIPGVYAKVDADRYPLFQHYRWQCYKSRSGSGEYYFRARVYGKLRFLHHLVAGSPLGSYHTDHLNRDTLDNRTCNLRTVTQRSSMINRRKFRSCGQEGAAPLSASKWVSRRSDTYRTRPWYVQFQWPDLRRGGRRMLNLGHYTTEAEAASVAKRLYAVLHGSDAITSGTIDNPSRKVA